GGIRWEGFAQRLQLGLVLEARRAFALPPPPPGEARLPGGVVARAAAPQDGLPTASRARSWVGAWASAAPGRSCARSARTGLLLAPVLLGSHCRESQGATGGCWSVTQASSRQRKRVGYHHTDGGLTPPHAAPLGRQPRGVRRATALCCHCAALRPRR